MKKIVLTILATLISLCFFLLIFYDSWLKNTKELKDSVGLKTETPEEKDFWYEFDQIDEKVLSKLLNLTGSNSIDRNCYESSLNNYFEKEYKLQYLDKGQSINLIKALAKSKESLAERVDNSFCNVNKDTNSICLKFSINDFYGYAKMYDIKYLIKDLVDNVDDNYYYIAIKNNICNKKSRNIITSWYGDADTSNCYDADKKAITIKDQVEIIENKKSRKKVIYYKFKLNNENNYYLASYKVQEY